MGFSLAEAYIELSAKGGNRVMSTVQQIHSAVGGLPSAVDTAEQSLSHLNQQMAQQAAAASQVGQSVSEQFGQVSSTLDRVSLATGATSLGLRGVSGAANLVGAAVPGVRGVAAALGGVANAAGRAAGAAGLAAHATAKINAARGPVSTVASLIGKLSSSSALASLGISGISFAMKRLGHDTSVIDRVNAKVRMVALASGVASAGLHGVSLAGRMITRTVALPFQLAGSAVGVFARLIPGATSVLELMGRTAQSAARSVGLLGSSMRQTGDAAAGMGSKLQGAQQGASRLGSVLSFAGGSLLSSGIMAITSAASQAVGSMFSLAASAEQTDVAFEVMLGSADKSKTILTEMRTLAAKTPLGTSDVVAATRKLIEYTVPAEEAVEVTRMLGDVTGGSSERLKSMALAFGQMTANTKLAGQDLRQMVDAGFNPLNEIARKTGASYQSLVADMEAGAISSDMVRSAFESATSEGGRYNNMLYKQGGTLAGSYAQLADAVERTLGTVGSRVAKLLNLNAMLDGSGNWLMGMQDDIGRFFDSLKPITDWFSSFAGKLSTNIQSQINAYAAFGELALTVIQKLTNGASELWVAMDGSAWLDWWIATATTFNNSVTEMFRYGTSLVRNWDIGWQILGEQVRLFAMNSFTRVENLFKNFGVLGSWLYDNWTGVFFTIGNYVKTFFTNLGGNIKAFWDSITGYMKTGNWKDAAFKGLLEGAQSAIKNMPEFQSSVLLESTDKLDALNAELSRRTDAFNAANAMASTPAIAMEAAARKSEKKTGSAPAATSEQKQPQFVGLAELSRKIQTSIDGTANKIPEKQLTEAKQQTQLLADTVAVMKDVASNTAKLGSGSAVFA